MYIFLGVGHAHEKMWQIVALSGVIAGMARSYKA